MLDAGNYEEEAVNERERLVEQIISLSTQVMRWLDIRFPEFSEVFKKWSGLAALLTLLIPISGLGMRTISTKSDYIKATDLMLLN